MDMVVYGLAALLLLQVGLTAWVYWPRAARSSAIVPLFGELPAAEVVSLSITDDRGQEIHLAKTTDAGWVLPAFDDFPVQAGKVEGLFGKLAELTTGRLVARNEASYARLRVADDEFIRRLAFNAADGRAHTLYIGSAPRFRATHVRKGDQDAVYLAGNLTSTDADVAPRNWIDTIYFQATEADIQTLQITNANGSLAFSKDESGIWAMAGLEEFNDNNLIALVTTLTNLNMAEPLGSEELAEYGMDEPTAVVTLTTLDPAGARQTHTLTIGAQVEEDNNYVVKSSGSAYYVLVPAYTLERFIEWGASDFLKPTPTPAATPEPSSPGSE